MGIITDVHAFFSKKGQDAHGQPVAAGLRRAAVADRKISELIGMIRMVMNDGELEHGEADFLLQWLEANRECAGTWPASALYPRLVSALEDGVIDPEEERELLELLMKTIGRPDSPAPGVAASYATKLPITEPAPLVIFEARSFCFTGKLMSGTRPWALQQVQDRGGLAADNITKKLHYLVIGDLGSRDWAQSTHGRKIEKALAYITDGAQLAILSEEHWFNSL